MARILLAEDEVNIASFIERGLQEFDHEVCVAVNGQQAWEILQKESFNLLILDVVMPKMNGLELCSRYRKQFGYGTPVIMLTALGTTEDIISGLDAGADDYLVKPFRFLELEARVKALLRRGQPATIAMETQSIASLQCGELTLDPTNRQVMRKGKTINLTIKEYRLLEQLVNNKGKAVPREELLRHVWGEKDVDRTNVVDVYVNYLRGKIDKGFRTKLIRTVSGVGYMIEA